MTNARGAWPSAVLAVLALELAVIVGVSWRLLAAPPEITMPRVLDAVFLRHALGRFVFATAAVAVLRGRVLTVALAEEGSPRFPARGAAVHVTVFASLVAVVLTGLPTAAWTAAALLVGLAWLVSGAIVFLLTRRPLRVWTRVLQIAWAPALGGAVFGELASTLAPMAVGSWSVLSRPTLLVVRAILRMFTSDVVFDPTRDRIGTSTFTARIAPTCGGAEGIALVVLALAAYLWVCRRDLRFPRALAILPIGVVAMWFANSTRIALLIAVGSNGFKEIARQGFHSHMGWILFNVVTISLVAMTRTSAFLRPDGARRVAEAEDDGVALLAPFAALMASVLVTDALSAGFVALYPLRVLAVAFTVILFRRSYGRASFSWSWPPIVIGIAVYGLWIAFTRVAPAGPPPGLRALSTPLAAAWVGARVLGSVVAVPIAEELAFRGYVVRRLAPTGGTFPWKAFVVSTVTFGAMHAQVVAGMVAGALFFVALRRRRRIEDAIVAHATANALLAAHVLLTGNWAYWG